MQQLFVLINLCRFMPPHFRVWNIITSGFVHINLLSLPGNISFLVLCGRYLEPIWGKHELFKFILLVNITSAFATCLTRILLYFIFYQPFLLINNSGGFSSVTAAFCVALKQLTNEQEIMGYKFKSKFLPAIMILWTFAISMLPFMSGALSEILVVLYGSLFSWIYLRWYQVNRNITGDNSEQFQFSHFFPEFLESKVAVISNIFFSICCMPKTQDIQQVRENENIIKLAELMENPTDEAERRRNLGLKVVEEHLNSIIDKDTV
eukprot:TRINITY_DN6374_c1_g5_i1.p1 TRINITY_DN6374_c1_g5~~TRINITY_DN6374_c1_g5_i1.p1  ORF type:complete len:264 (-),score=37.34 TRINITY_DN6374_c1_g5_i1:736-1527(-)